MTEENFFFKTGKEDCSNYYYRFSEETGERLHFLFKHPKYESLEGLKDKYKTVILKDICIESIHRGEQPEYTENGEVTVIKTVDLKNSFIDYENCLKVSNAFFETVPTAQVKKGDILIASTGYVSMGKVDIYDRDEPAIVDGHISVLCLNEEYDPYFVAYFLRSRLGKLQFEKWFSGSSGQIEVKPDDFGLFILPHSSDEGIPLKIQKEIAIKTAKKFKESYGLEQKAQKIRIKAEELLLSELGIDSSEEEKVDYYCFGFSEIGNRLGYGNYHPSVKQLEISLEKSKYAPVLLSELVTLKYDSIEPSKNPDREYYYIGLENIESNTGRLKDIPKLKGRNISSKSNVFKKGQLMFSGLRPYLNKCFILEEYEEAIGSAGLYARQKRTFLWSF